MNHYESLDLGIFEKSNSYAVLITRVMYPESERLKVRQFALPNSGKPDIKPDRTSLVDCEITCFLKEREQILQKCDMALFKCFTKDTFLCSKCRIMVIQHRCFPTDRRVMLSFWDTRS